MQVRAKYVTEFTARKGKIVSSRVFGDEVATDDQRSAITATKPMLRKFVQSRLRDELQFENCTINVRTSYVESSRGLEITFRV